MNLQAEKLLQSEAVKLQLQLEASAQGISEVHLKLLADLEQLIKQCSKQQVSLRPVLHLERAFSTLFEGERERVVILRILSLQNDWFDWERFWSLLKINQSSCFLFCLSHAASRTEAQTFNQLHALWNLRKQVTHLPIDFEKSLLSAFERAEKKKCKLQGLIIHLFVSFWTSKVLSPFFCGWLKLLPHDHCEYCHKAASYAISAFAKRLKDASEDICNFYLELCVKENNSKAIVPVIHALPENRKCLLKSSVAHSELFVSAVKRLPAPFSFELLYLLVEAVTVSVANDHLLRCCASVIHASQLECPMIGKKFDALIPQKLDLSPLLMHIQYHSMRWLVILFALCHSNAFCGLFLENCWSAFSISIQPESPDWEAKLNILRLLVISPLSRYKIYQQKGHLFLVRLLLSSGAPKKPSIEVVFEALLSMRYLESAIAEIEGGHINKIILNHFATLPAHCTELLFYWLGKEKNAHLSLQVLHILHNALLERPKERKLYSIIERAHNHQATCAFFGAHLSPEEYQKTIVQIFPNFPSITFFDLASDVPIAQHFALMRGKCEPVQVMNFEFPSFPPSYATFKCSGGEKVVISISLLTQLSPFFAWIQATFMPFSELVFIPEPVETVQDLAQFLATQTLPIPSKQRYFALWEFTHKYQIPLLQQLLESEWPLEFDDLESFLFISSFPLSPSSSFVKRLALRVCQRACVYAERSLLATLQAISLTFP